MAAKTEKIKKVHVIFKTHLDIGYTDLSSNVLRKYREEYIPKAIEIARKMNSDSKREFVWTVGSFLIDDYLLHAAPEQAAAMEEAIKRGDISWHGLATTTHSELMDPELLKFNLSISENLDKRFGVKTIGAKMTDVPGHTIAIVPFLYDAGIEYLHIGVNSGSAVPGVPEMFRWRFKDKEIVVHYSNDYGASLVIDGFDEAVEYAYTSDNMGPQSVEDVRNALKKIQEKYPNAQVVASTISEYAKAVRRIRDTLPVITEEIGDTWIHGAGTDPVKISIFEDLLRCKSRWLKDGRMTPQSPFYHEFMRNLLLVSEHTWGLDIKKYLIDFTNWEKKDFCQARKNDVTDSSLIPQVYGALRDMVEQEAKQNGKKRAEGSYSLFEKSHEDERNYLLCAVAALPDELREEAKKCFVKRNVTELEKPKCEETITPLQTMAFGEWKCRVSANGGLSFLSKNDRIVADSANENEVFGSIVYEVFDAVTVKKAHFLYNVNLEENLVWTESGFSKPGLEKVKNLKNHTAQFAVKSIVKEDNSLYVYLKGDEYECENFGCPRDVLIIYTFSEKVYITLQWINKDASRIPEAIWFGFSLHNENPYCWKMEKTGSLISPFNVVKGGNRNLHYVRRWHYSAADGNIKISSLNAPLCSVGGRGLYRLDNKFANPENGIWFNIFNNRWSTNFRNWCEDNVSLEFEIEVF